MEECKRCLLLESAREDIFALVQEHLQKIPEGKKAPEALYRQRLALCLECEHLMSGTCIKCGCYVELRAAFLGQKCPDAKQKKW